jgi:hypothetical protein
MQTGSEGVSEGSAIASRIDWTNLRPFPNFSSDRQGAAVCDPVTERFVRRWRRYMAHLDFDSLGEKREKLR